MIFRLLALVGLPPWFAPVLIAAVIASGLGGAYLKGRIDAAATCREAALEAQIKAMERDRDAAKAAEAEATRRAQALALEADKRAKEVASYEEELRKRPDRCDLTPRDLDWLRLHNGEGKAR